MAKMDYEKAARKDSVTGAGSNKSSDRFGRCPNCGGNRWWDNREKKAKGEYKPNAPDAKCSECGYAVWPPKSRGARSTRPVGWGTSV